MALSRLFGIKTVDTAIAGFLKVISDLEEVALAHNNQAADKLDLAKAYHQEAQAHIAEVNRAGKLSDKLRALFEEDEVELQSIKEIANDNAATEVVTE